MSQKVQDSHKTLSIFDGNQWVILYLFYPDRKLNPGQSQNVQVLPTFVGEENTSTTIQTSTWTEGHLVMDKHIVFSGRFWVINFDEPALFDSESCVVWNTSFTLLFGKVAMRWSILLSFFLVWSLCSTGSFCIFPDTVSCTWRDMIQYTNE